MSGNLVIKPLSAKLTRDTETFGKMDPFCVILFGGQRQQTQVAKDAGKFPSWNDQFSFRRNAEDLMTVEVWDQDGVSKNDMIGQGSFALASVLKGGKSSNWVQLSYKGKDAGQVLIEIEFYPDDKKSAAPAGGVAYGAYPGMPMGGVYPIPMMPMGGAGYMPMGGAMPMGYAQPPAGYGYPPAGYAQPPMGYAQPPAGYAGGYAQPPAGGYAQPPAGGYAQPPAGGYAQPPAGGYAQPPAGGYAQPPAGYQPPGGYPQQYPGQYPPGYK